MSVVTLQAEINGYKGQAVNLLAAVDAGDPGAADGTGLVIVSQELPLGHREPGAMMTSNDPRAPARDLLFDESMIAAAIDLYFRADSTGMIELLSPVQRFNPGGAVQVRGVAATGTRYELNPEITNGQIAVLALMYAANRSMSVADTSEFADEMAEMYFTI
ncbi:hypothetical protein [Paraburkholderia sp. C35]|uniref:hypothetical protein n=1 Tax=Paraburkholderia sp. C35 TaxID=2126993 RepID=UPI000D68EC23|nr:hypothetical protein [Paraburkholderia sp. C35]